MTSLHLLQLSLAVLFVDSVVETVFPIGSLGQVRNLYLGKHVDTLTLSEGQVIHIERVLGPDVAAGKAVATIDTGVLVDTDMVGAPVAEMNGQRQRWTEVGIGKLVCPLFHGLNLELHRGS